MFYLLLITEILEHISCKWRSSHYLFLIHITFKSVDLNIFFHDFVTQQHTGQNLLWSVYSSKHSSPVQKLPHGKNARFWGLHTHIQHVEILSSSSSILFSESYWNESQITAFKKWLVVITFVSNNCWAFKIRFVRLR